MVKKLEKRDPLELLLAKHPVVRSQELLRVLKNHTAIKRASDSGLITPLGSGFYAAPSVDPFVGAVLAANRFFPKAVISNLTALVIHGLSDERIDRVDVDILRSDNARNRLLRVHRISKDRLAGVGRVEFHGWPIRAYDRERALCEAYKIDPAGPIFFKALKRYLKQGAVKADAIARYDKVLKTKTLIHLQQELADA